jgi:hypothetical protein
MFLSIIFLLIFSLHYSLLFQTLQQLNDLHTTCSFKNVISFILQYEINPFLAYVLGLDALIGPLEQRMQCII